MPEKQDNFRVRFGLITGWMPNFFVRSVASGAGPEMLHHRFISRANDGMYLTRKLIGNIRNKAQLEVLGIHWPPPRGWSRTLRNTTIPDDKWATIMSLARANPDSNNRKCAYEAYLKSDHWRNLKAQKKAIVGRTCEVCNSNRTIHVHHINYRNLTDCTPDDLAVLCASCHDALHTFAAGRNFSLLGVCLPEIKTLLAEFRATPEFQERELQIASRKSSLRPAKPVQAKRRLPNEAKSAIKRCRRSGYSVESITTLIAELQELLVRQAALVRVRSAAAPLQYLQAPNQLQPC